MERVNSILRHPLYQQNIEMIKTAEADRCFCRHDMVHFLDVARIAMILNLREQLGLEEHVVYGAALLHDAGKHLQYSDGIPHEKASADIAPTILADCGYTAEETRQITDAILSHRDETVREEKSLRGILYRADKASRACFCCPEEKDCNWSKEKKNLSIKY